MNQEKRDRFVALQLEMDAYDREHNVGSSTNVFVCTEDQTKEYNELLQWFQDNPQEDDLLVREEQSWQRSAQSPDWPASAGLQPIDFGCIICNQWIGSARAFIYHFDHCTPTKALLMRKDRS